MARLSDAFLSRKAATGATSMLEIIPGVKFRIAFIGGTPDFVKRLGDMKKDDDSSDFINAIASDILLGWEGLDNDDGTPMEATFDNRVKLLRDYVGIIEQVVTFARDPKNFTECNKSPEDGVKN